MTHESYEAFIGPRNTISDDGAVPASSAPAFSPEGRSDQTAKAIEAFQQALRINPEYAGAWSSLGHAYRQFGQHAKAIEALQQAVRIDPNNARAWIGLGATYKFNGQDSKVIEVYRRLQQIDPGMADEFFNEFVLP